MNSRLVIIPRNLDAADIMLIISHGRYNTLLKLQMSTEMRDDRTNDDNISARSLSLPDLLAALVGSSEEVRNDILLFSGIEFVLFIFLCTAHECKNDFHECRHAKQKQNTNWEKKQDTVIA
jgi:hypothetical protein